MLSSGSRIGVDVGGSHISAASITGFKNGMNVAHHAHIPIDSADSAHNILQSLKQCIRGVAGHLQKVEAVGIAFPGPFDYDNGISAIANVGGKFEKTFGLHCRQVLKDLTGLGCDVPIHFFNDAHCFAAGAYHLYQLLSSRTVFITLGTGFGSAFMVDGQLVNTHTGIPESGAFYNQIFQNGIADDFFSSRWILTRYHQIAQTHANSVKEIAESQSPDAIKVMEELGQNLGSFLYTWLKKFDCDELIIGGNIAKAYSIFSKSLKKELGELAHKLNIMNTDNTEECIIAGAAALAGNKEEPNSSTAWRKTTQHLMPATNPLHSSNTYNIYPSFTSHKIVSKGFSSLADAIAEEKVLLIDGYSGVLWESFRTRLHTALSAKSKKIFWYNVNTCLKPATDIFKMIETHLNGDDPVFGKRYTGTLQDFFDTEKLNLITPDPAADICIVYGTGASLTNFKGKKLYIDVPKNEIQFRMRAGSVTNLGADSTNEPTQMYKRFYFVDCPVLNKHKAAMLPEMAVVIDEQRKDEITWMKGDAFRSTLQKMAQQPFRARPWFEPGIWGGDWMKKRIPGLNQNVINYAWSFELISPENGIVIEGNDNLLEVSFDFLMYAENQKMLGKAAKRFGTEFPVRFDFLDTFNGGNLSIQCHPRAPYAKERFGENFTQDETYYIIDCEKDAVVYLGFQDNIQPEPFKEALNNAQNNGVDPNIEQYVQKLPAKKHDLFLIPNGTIHASGINNLVLEISSTPYIFTFKMYDWLRLGLNGQPRPINIEHGMNNLYFDRKGSYVFEKLVSHPVVEEEWANGRKLQLPTHEEHFYSVHRYEFTDGVRINTNNQCHICMLVEGKKIQVTANESNSVFHYAETFVIPAATESYEIKNTGLGIAYVVVAQVKEDHC